MKKNKPTEAQIKAAMVDNTQKQAAEILGISYRTLKRRLHEMRSRGYAPEHDWTETVPEGFFVKGESELVRTPSGGIKWIKSERDKEFFARALNVIAQSFGSELKKTEPVALPAKIFDFNSLACYILTDAHIGMYANGKETRGSDWNLKIAEDTIVEWFRHVIRLAPATEKAVLANLGDYFHYCSMVAQTPLHNNPLDASGRFGEMVDVGIRVMRRIIELLLKKHEKVHVFLVSGNHDDPLMAVMRRSFPIFYENEPRISFDTSDNNFYCYEFGNVMLGFTHGDKAQKRLVQTMVAHFPEAYGRTKCRVLHHGHLHHFFSKDDTLLMKEECHATLSAGDAYAALNGYLSNRYSSCIIYDKHFGDIMRINPPASIVEGDLPHKLNNFK